MKNLLILLLLLSTILISFAQDISFSQPYNNALYLNPAFAGAFINPTFTASYRDHGPSIFGVSKTGIIEYNQYSDAIHGGIGGYVIYDNGYDNESKTELAKLIYSFRIEVSNKVIIQPAFGAGYTRESITWEELDSTGNFYNPERKVENSIGFFDCTAGLLLYSKYFFGGFAIDHLARPDVSEFPIVPIFDIESKLTLHAGANIPITDSISSVCVSPDVIYSYQEDFYSFQTGITIKVKYVRAGIAYRVQQQSEGYLTFSAGFQNSFIRVSYSYEKMTDYFSNSNNYTHEVSLSYTLKTSKQQNRLALQMIAF